VTVVSIKASESSVMDYKRIGSWITLLGATIYLGIFIKRTLDKLKMFIENENVRMCIRKTAAI
jgi:hypothetical protein